MFNQSTLKHQPKNMANFAEPIDLFALYGDCYDIYMSDKQQCVEALSSLSPFKKKLVREKWKEIRRPDYDKFVHDKLKVLAEFYLKQVKSNSSLGAIFLTHKEDCEKDVYHCDFYPFESCTDLSLKQTLNHFQQQDPSKMPIVFVKKPIIDHLEQICCRGVDQYINIDEDMDLIGFYDISEVMVEDLLTNEAMLVKHKKERKAIEHKLEEELYAWLRVKGFTVERQVSTAKHRLDLWLQDNAMLELKQGRVSGDDVCQAIDYASTYHLPIILVGTGLSTAASRGIEGFNRGLHKEAIVFVTWGAIRPYINGLLD